MKHGNKGLVLLVILSLLISLPGCGSAAASKTDTQGTSSGGEAVEASQDKADETAGEAGDAVETDGASAQQEGAQTEETGGEAAGSEGGAAGAPAEETGSETAGSADSAEGASAEEAEEPAEKNGEVIILYTSDVHCGIDQGFGYAGLYQLRQSLEDQGYTTLLVDDGDSIQGETIGTLTSGEAIIDLMNAVGYDVAIPGNHEFDYGVPRFLELAEKAAFPYVCCNFTKEGEVVFDPYVILEAAGMKIAFVGVTTPKTLTSSTPAYFQNEAGEFIYGFMQDGTGERVYQAVQDAVDAARAEGADYVYAMGHLGMGTIFSPWNYADVISNTTGIDVFLDGHSHDMEQVVMKNKDGQDVVRSGVGTKMAGIGYSIISHEGGIQTTDILKWPNSMSAPEAFALENEITARIAEETEKISELLDQVVATSDVLLTINDPEPDANGNPVRMIRRAETNLGDFCADAFLDQTGADIAVINGGGIRTDLARGEITYGDIISVFPFGNDACTIEAKGQQILDALEWGCRMVPEQSGAFLQVAGMSYEIDISVPTPCVFDENNLMTAINGERRVRNVMVGEEPLDPEKTYVVAGTNYTLLLNGDGQTAFDGAAVIEDSIKLDNQLLIDYIVESLGGNIGEEYADPYGEGRITIVGE